MRWGLEPASQLQAGQFRARNPRTEQPLIASTAASEARAMAEEQTDTLEDSYKHFPSAVET